MNGHDDRLIRLLVGNALVGAAAGVGTVALLLGLDVAGLRGLVARSDAGGLALAVMTAFFVITFASVQMGVAVSGLAGGDGGPRPGLGVRSRAPARLMPVPAVIRPRSRA